VPVRCSGGDRGGAAAAAVGRGGSVHRPKWLLFQRAKCLNWSDRSTETPSPASLVKPMMETGSKRKNG
jgi:hypothetical protein